MWSFFGVIDGHSHRIFHSGFFGVIDGHRIFHSGFKEMQECMQQMQRNHSSAATSAAISFFKALLHVLDPTLQLGPQRSELAWRFLEIGLKAAAYPLDSQLLAQIRLARVRYLWSVRRLLVTGETLRDKRAHCPTKSSFIWTVSTSGDKTHLFLAAKASSFLAEWSNM